MSPDARLGTSGRGCATCASAGPFIGRVPWGLQPPRLSIRTATFPPPPRRMEKRLVANRARATGLLIVGIALASSHLFMAPTNASTVTVEDQSNPGPAYSNGVVFFGSDRVAQVFQAGVSGQLTKITLWGCNEQDVLTSVSVQVYPATSSPPNATPPALPSTALGGASISGSQLATIPDNSNCLPAQSFDVFLDSPAPIVAGNLYTFVVSATASASPGGLRLRGSTITTYPAGNRADSADSGATWTARTDRNLLFTTYVDVGVEATQAQTFELSLTPSDGTRCTNSSQSGIAGTWVTLPGASECTPPATRPNARLLGWATSPDFPVSIAQRQVDNGWGAYEIYDDEGRIAAVYIPAGGAAFLTGDNTLHPIWSS